MGFDTHIENRTPFDVQLHVQLDTEGQEVTVVMLSASFAADAAGRVGLAEEPLPVTYGDVPWGDPARCSTRYEADIAPKKPIPEIVVNASAHAPGGRPAESVAVGLRVGDVRKVLQVTGDRVQHLGALSRPSPFATLPIRWERAWGGTGEDGATEPRNPVGIGFRSAASADPEARSAVANVTLPAEVIQAVDGRAEPVGFGGIGRGWQPRLSFAGTYDQAWLDRQWPLPPKDFDNRHHQSAPADQQSPAIRPGAEVTLINMTPEGRWEFRLPRLTAPVRLLRDDAVEETAFEPDTVIVEPDLRRITLKARMAFVTRRTAPKLREIVVGHVSPVFLSARRKRKEYFNPTGGDGTLAGVSPWSA